MGIRRSAVRIAPLLLLVASVSLCRLAAFPSEAAETPRPEQAPGYLLPYLQAARDAEAGGSADNASKAYRECAIVARNKGDFQNSLRCADKAIGMAERSGAAKQLYYSLTQSAITLQSVGQYDKAVGTLKRAGSTAGEAGWNAYKARAYAQLADIQVMHYRNHEEALVYLRWIDDFYATVKAKDKNPPRGFSQWLGKFDRRRLYVATYHLMGRTYTRMGRYDPALESLRTAVQFSEPFPDLSAYSCYWMGVVYRMKGEPDAAIAQFAKALDLLSRIDDVRLSALVHAGLGRAYHEAGQPEKASEHFSTALPLMENQRSLIQTEDIRQGFLEPILFVYDFYIEYLAAQGKDADAFSVSERARARTLLDILGSKVNLDREQTKEIAREEREYQRKLAELQLRMQESEEEGDAGGRDREAIRREMAALGDRHSAILAKLSQLDPEQYSLVSVNPLTAGEVQALLGPGRKLVEYYVLPRKLLVWTITENGVSLSTVPISRKQLVGKVKALRTLLEKGDAVRSLRMTEDPRSRDPEGNAKETDAALRELYEILFRGTPLKQGEQLVIVPHGVLHYLPFQALRTPDETYLLQKCTISYLSSASLLKFLQEKRKQAGDTLLALGNPDLGVPALRLKFAEQEVREIGETFPGSKILIGADATRRNAQRLSGKYDRLHFATHAIYNEDAPLESALLLARDGREGNTDFTVRDIFRLRLHASLVVLSACETMLGNLLTGDELIGFTRAFLYAGTPSVITTLWKIDDQASYQLMKEFYRHLKTMGKAQALRTAQLDVMEQYPHPYFWAAFVLSGED